MAKIYQCGFSSFIYELFEDEDGTIRATKTSVKNGTLCLAKRFVDAEAGRSWIVERSALDQQFIMACKQLAERSDE
jgi:hypothetical protein